VIDEQGGESYRPDHRAALELYRRLVAEFDEGETRYRRQAEGAIQEITRPELQVLVSNAFLPGSEVAFDLLARNLGEVELALHPVELDGALDLKGARGRLDPRSVGGATAPLLVELDPRRHAEQGRIASRPRDGRLPGLARSGLRAAPSCWSPTPPHRRASGEARGFLCDARSASRSRRAVVFWTWRAPARSASPVARRRQSARTGSPSQSAPIRTRA
jgi:hypothetical protein